LSADDVAHLLGGSGRETTALAESLIQQTSGNPFFIEELVRDGIEMAAGTVVPVAVPERIRFFVGRRLEHLSEPAQTLVNRAAIFANGFDLPVLQRMLDLGDEQILDALDESLTSRVLEPVPGFLERYDYVHAIVRQCLESRWNPSRKVRLHRQAAEAIESVYGGRSGSEAAEIAVQYHRSLTLPGAINGLPHALRVVQECRDQCTPEHAVTFLRIARDLSREGPLDQQASVVGQLASAEAEIVQVEASLDTLDEYLTIVDQAGVPAIDVAERLDIVARSLKYSAYAEERHWRPIVDRALKMVGPDDGRIWARLHLMLDPVVPISRSGVRVGRWVGFDRVAKDILRASADEDDIARSLESFDAVSRAETDRYLTRMRGCSSPTAAMYGLTVAANHYQYRHGAFRDARRLWQELIDLSERAGAIHWQQQATNQLTYLLVADGNFGAAARMERAANDLSTRLGPGQNPAAHRLEMATCRAMYQGGDWAEIAAHWREMLDDPALGPHDLTTLTGAYYAGLAAYCAAQADRMADARQILDLLTPIIRQMRPSDCSHNGAVAFAAGTVWRLGATDLAPIYRALAHELIETGSGDYPQTSLHLTLGQMCALMDRPADALNAWTTARAIVAANGQQPLLPIIDVTEAESLLRWGDPETYPRIMELAGAARARFATFEMTPWLQDLQVIVDISTEKFLRKQHLPGHITEREADVLRLIARGFSDRQISDELFVSPRTINAHVRNMLAKTDAANRVELAMWARSNGIVQS
jgi:DNA-binding CsgD family transcriptional regulator